MRRLVLLALSIALAIPAFSQQNLAVKGRDKKPAGTTKFSFTYKTITPQTRKSATISPYKTINSLPQIQGKAIVGKDSVKNIILSAGSPIFFEREKSSLKSTISASANEQFYSFFGATKAITGLNDPESELAIISSDTDELGKTHVKAQQYFRGIKVDGGEFYLHLGAQKDVFTGRIRKIDPNIDLSPEISESIAVNTVKSDISKKTTLRNLSPDEKKILNYDAPEAELAIYNNTLAYLVTIRPNLIEVWKYYVNANTGKIIYSFNNTNSDGPATATGVDLNGVTRTINTYQEGGTYKLIDAAETMFNATTNEGIIVTLNANNTSTVDLSYSEITSANNNTWNIPASVSAHYNAMTTFKYFKNTFNRNSINGKGGNIISLINVANEDGSSMDNAFWNGQAAFFGNGDVAFKSLAGALDVTAHEMGHGIISNSANLEYQGQSGAINESFADIFGSMVDRDDWLIGEDITKTSYSPSGALRNMQNPHNLGNANDHYWQPMHVSEMYEGDGDNGGVHINSGICNHAFYLFATSVSKTKAEQVFYKALTNYLTSKSQFIDLRIAVVQSAKDLYGEGSAEQAAANEAFDAVGIYEEAQIDYAQDYAVNPGQDYFLLFNTDPADSNSLYRANTAGSAFDPLSTTVSKSKASVTDDGTVGAFVSSDSKIRSIGTIPATSEEFILSEDPIWDNVAVSKNGRLLAAITTEVDTAIYVYDFVTQVWAKFPLYNPTTSTDGTNAGGVLYADEFEFDHTGEYLVYDSYNSLNSATGSDISYWDIGFLKVWDNASNDFGDGSINKLYGSLPENISIGDPTFSKNSPYIMAFDYIDNNTNSYSIYGVNLLTSESGLIVNNNTIGYPSYSKSDDKVAFTVYETDGLGNAKDNFEDIGVVSVAADKITGTGSVTIPIVGAKWPVYYTQGDRSLELAPVAYFTVDVKAGPAPLSVHFQDLSINVPTSWTWSFPGGTPSSSNLQNPVISYNTEGVYQVSLTCSNVKGNNSVTKTGYISVSLGNNVPDLNGNLISWYPNPVNDRLFIQSANDFRLKIFNLTGSLLVDVSNEKEVSLSALQRGIYIIQIETAGKLITDKIIVE